jgi:hypothetical protein
MGTYDSILPFSKLIIWLYLKFCSSILINLLKKTLISFLYIFSKPKSTEVKVTII